MRERDGKKGEVLQELPDLIETTYHNELDESQKTIYLAQLKQIQDRVRSSSEEELNRSKVEILSSHAPSPPIPSALSRRLSEIVEIGEPFEIFGSNQGWRTPGFDLLSRGTVGYPRAGIDQLA